MYVRCGCCTTFLFLIVCFQPLIAGANTVQNPMFSVSIPSLILAMAATRAREGFDLAQVDRSRVHAEEDEFKLDA